MPNESYRQRSYDLTKGESIVLVPKRSAEDMRGFMRGANPENYRDREDRY
jgi:hypothetical protein